MSVIKSQISKIRGTLNSGLGYTGKPLSKKRKEILEGKLKELTEFARENNILID